MSALIDRSDDDDEDEHDGGEREGKAEKKTGRNGEYKKSGKPSGQDVDPTGDEDEDEDEDEDGAGSDESPRCLKLGKGRAEQALQQSLADAGDSDFDFEEVQVVQNPQISYRGQCHSENLDCGVTSF